MRLILCSAFLLSCSGAGANAVFSTGVALASAAASRSAGGCYASCPTGTACNPKTGYCDEVPCRGLCSSLEECVGWNWFAHCETRRSVVLETTSGPAPKPPDPPPDDSFHPL
jgi:hypothetical protein